MRDKGARVGSTLGLACGEGLWGAAALLGTKGFESTGTLGWYWVGSPTSLCFSASST